MKCELVFYLARKTGYCEKALKGALKEPGIEINHTSAATSPKTLGEQLCRSFSVCNLVFIVGGLGFSDSTNLSNVLSRALSSTSVTADHVRRLKNTVGKLDGYLVRCGNQLIVALPDDPTELTAMLSPVLKDYLRRLYSLG